jgi:hypothetical protein
VFQGARDVVQAAAALRKHTAERAKCAQEALELACSADAVLLKEHKEMLHRYQIKLYSTAMERHGQNPSIDDQVCMRACSTNCCGIFFPYLLHALFEGDRFWLFVSKSFVLVRLEFIHS